MLPVCCWPILELHGLGVMLELRCGDLFGISRLI